MPGPVDNSNVLAYSTRDFQSAMDDLNSDPKLAEVPEPIKRMFAGTVDNISNTINAEVNALHKDTAFSRPHAIDLYRLTDFELGWKQTSSVNMALVLNIGPYTVPKAQLRWKTIGSASKDPLQWEARQDLVLGAVTTTTIKLYQQVTQLQANLGKTSGESFQVVDLPYLDVIPETAVVTIDGETYALVKSMVRQSPIDRCFKIYFRSDGSSYIKLPGISQPSGTQFGFVPDPDLDILFDCATGGGAVSLIPAGLLSSSTSTATYIGGNANILTWTQAVASQDGRDPVTLAEARETSEIFAKSNFFFGNKDSGRGIALAVPGVQDVFLERTGVLEVTAYIIPNGGGTPSPELKAAVALALLKAAMWEEVTIITPNPNFVEIDNVIGVKMLPGFVFADQLPYMKLAAAYRESENSAFIYRKFVTNGLAAAIDQINSSFAYLAISYTEDRDGSAILNILEHVAFQATSEPLQKTDVSTAVEGFVAGVDYSVVTTPDDTAVPTGSITRPVSLTFTEIP